MKQITFNIPEPIPQLPALKQMLLLEHIHMTFETWFVRQFQMGLLPEGDFSIIMMRREYLALCWKEELLWKEWTKDVKE